MKAVEATFNQEKALVGTFSVIVQLCRLIVNSSTCGPRLPCWPGARGARLRMISARVTEVLGVMVLGHVDRGGHDSDTCHVTTHTGHSASS